MEIIGNWLNKRGCFFNQEERQIKQLRGVLENLGWGRSILFSPKELHTYEERISPDLKSLTLIATHTTDDVRGGKIFPLVEKNLTRGVDYTYLFFDYPGSKRQLESIYHDHDASLHEHLTLKLIKSKAWICGDILLIKIYEYKSNAKSEIFFRIKMSADSKSEQCIYIKGDNNKIPIIQQEIDDFWMNSASCGITGKNGCSRLTSSTTV